MGLDSFLTAEDRQYLSHSVLLTADT